VPKTSSGSIRWDEKIETASTAIFAIILKEKFLHVGVTNEKIIVVDDATVELRNRRGEIVESYHACEKVGHHLL
jgi:hypothetical protein